MESLGVTLQERTSIFMRPDAVVWKCRVHCILQHFALPVFGIAQIIFPAAIFFPFTNHACKRKPQREEVGAVSLSKLWNPSIAEVNSFLKGIKGAYGFRHMFQEDLAKSGCLFFLPLEAGILQ